MAGTELDSLFLDKGLDSGRTPAGLCVCAWLLHRPSRARPICLACAASLIKVSISLVARSIVEVRLLPDHRDPSRGHRASLAPVRLTLIDENVG